MLKNVAKTFPIISSVSVSTPGTVVISSATSIQYLDNVGLQWNWSGNPSGNMQVQASVDYNPGLPQTGQFQNGAWNELALTTTPSTSSGSSFYINLRQVAAPWIRTVYVHSSASGVLSSYVYSKSQGL
jgi:hypothetical protein